MTRFLLMVSCLSVTAALWAACAGCTKVDILTATTEDQRRELLRKAATFVESQDHFRLTLEAQVSFEFPGMKNQMPSTYSICVARPNRFAIQLKGGDGVILVSDGKRYSRGISMLKRYAVGQAPSSLEDIFADPAAAFLGAGIGTGLWRAILSDDVYKQLMDGVTASRDMGVEKIGDDVCHHLQLSQKELDFDLWVEAGDRPLIRKFSAQPKPSEGKEGRDNEAMSISLVYQLRDWDLRPTFGAADFAFRAPSEWEKVDDLLGGSGGDASEAVHPMLGQSAPDFRLDRLDAGEVNFNAHRGKDVVILDFWATWCGPCRQALPTIAKVANQYRQRGVVFYAVDIREEADAIHEFLEKEKLDIAVLLDSDGAVAQLYQASGIPQTVLVGKDGRVQVVHVGLSGNLETRLKEELDALLDGKDLASQSPKPSQPRAEDRGAGVKLAWSHAGSWTGISSTQAEQAILAVGTSGTLIKLDAEGNVLTTTTVDDHATKVRAARLADSKDTQVLTFTIWGRTVKAHSIDGNLLWTYAVGEGVDDVWPADLDDDGIDEVIIGYNGSTGVHVLNSSGERLWENTEIGNVWHVLAANVEGDARPEVVTTSATGHVHIFDANGRRLRDFDPGIYGHMIRACHDWLDAKVLDLILVAGQSKPKNALVALDAQGKSRWSIELAADVVNASVCQQSPWLALVTSDGTVRVVEIASGQEVAQIKAQARRADVAWINGGQEPLLIVATGRSVDAYRVDPGN